MLEIQCSRKDVGTQGLENQLEQYERTNLCTLEGFSSLPVFTVSKGASPMSQLSCMSHSVGIGRRRYLFAVLHILNATC